MIEEKLAKGLTNQYLDEIKKNNNEIHLRNISKLIEILEIGDEKIPELDEYACVNGIVLNRSLMNGILKKIKPTIECIYLDVVDDCKSSETFTGKHVGRNKERCIAISSLSIEKVGKFEYRVVTKDQPIAIKEHIIQQFLVRSRNVKFEAGKTDWNYIKSNINDFVKSIMYQTALMNHIYVSHGLIGLPLIINCCDGLVLGDSGPSNMTSSAKMQNGVYKFIRNKKSNELGWTSKSLLTDPYYREKTKDIAIPRTYISYDMLKEEQIDIFNFFESDEGEIQEFDQVTNDLLVYELIDEVLFSSEGILNIKKDEYKDLEHVFFRKIREYLSMILSNEFESSINKLKIDKVEKDNIYDFIRSKRHDIELVVSNLIMRQY